MYETKWIPGLAVLSVTVSLGVACASGGGHPETAGANQSLAPGAQALGGTPAAAPAGKAVNAGECPKTPMVDDCEDGDNKTVDADKRGGYWFTYADSLGSKVEPTGNFQMSPGGANGSKSAARMHGKLGASGILYAGMGFSLTNPKSPYDASCCKGVSFWAKKDGTGTGNVRLKVGDVNTIPEGGVCKECYNDFGAEYVLTNDWKQYTLAFADMKQESGWGEPQPKIDTTRVYQLQWHVKDPGQEFDIWVDQVELQGCGQ